MPSTTPPLGSLDEIRLRKIALLIYSVDATAAQQLMLQLPSEIAADVRAIMATLSRPESSEQQRLLEEIQELTCDASATFGAQGGIEDAAETWGTDQSQESQASSPSWSDQNTEDIAEILTHERPPVIAAIISRLPAHRCIELLRCFQPELSSQIAGCISKLRELDTAIEAEIDDYMASKRSKQPSKPNQPQGSRRLHQLNAILQAAPDELQRHWRKALDQESQTSPTALMDSSLRAETTQPGRPKTHADALDAKNMADLSSAVDEPTEFELNAAAQEIRLHEARGSLADLAQEPVERLELLLQLTDSDLVSLFDQAEPETLVVALAGAAPALIDRLADVLDAERLSAIDEGMKQLEHLQLGDIDEAQERLLVLAQHISASRRLAS